MARVPFLGKTRKPAGATKMIPLEQALALLEARRSLTPTSTARSTLS